jgi:ADP-ribosylglycohydrolase
MIDPVLYRAVQEGARGAVVGLAVCDAFGAPVEFKGRDSFSEVREILAYFSLCVSIPAPRFFAKE